MKLELKRGLLLGFSGRSLSSNVYLIVVDNGVVAIACGMPGTANRVLDYLNKNRLRLEYIFLTHSHFDHVMSMKRLKCMHAALDDQLSFSVKYTGIHKAATYGTTRRTTIFFLLETKSPLQ